MLANWEELFDSFTEGFRHKDVADSRICEKGRTLDVDKSTEKSKGGSGRLSDTGDLRKATRRIF